VLGVHYGVCTGFGNSHLKVKRALNRKSTLRNHLPDEPASFADLREFRWDSNLDPPWPKVKTI
jgi:hypothetical protein